MKAIALNCTLKRGDNESSTGKLLKEVAAEFAKYHVEMEIIRVANFNVLPGVESDEGEGDEWPQLRKKILDANILIIGTPIWMGQPSSVCKRVFERMDAFLDEKDAQGRLVSYGIVGAAAIVGNEDGAHHCSSQIFQALNDVGFTIPAAAVTYWVGEAMGDKDYVDLKETPKNVTEATKVMALNAVHLARLLKEKHYPPQK